MRAALEPTEFQFLHHKNSICAEGSMACDTINNFGVIA